MFRYFLLIPIFVVMLNVAFAADTSKLRCPGILIGRKIINCSLLDTNGNSFQLVPRNGRQLILHFFDHNRTNGHSTLFNYLNRAYGSLQARNIDFVVVSSASLDSLQKTAQFHKPLFPMLHDAHKRVSSSCSALASWDQNIRSTIFIDERGYVHKTVVSLDIQEHLAQIFLYAFKQPVVPVLHTKP